MSAATNFMKLSLPFYSFRPNTSKLIPLSQRTANSNNGSLPFYPFRPSTGKLIPISQRNANSNNGASTLTKLSAWRLLAEVPSVPNYRPPSVSVLPPAPAPAPVAPEIPRAPELDPSDTPLEFTTSDPPPLGRPRPDPGPDFPKPPLGSPPTGPEVVPVPPSPGRKPPPVVDPPLPPDLVPPPSTPPDYVPPPSIPPDNPTPEIPPTKGPYSVF